MAFTLCSTFRYFSSFPVLVTLLVVLSQFCSRRAASHTTIKFLPGFQGPLPFHLETGYVGVGESEEVQLFYYFVKSERNPKEDPLMLWLTGGPGCSAFSAFVFQIGPLSFRNEDYNGSLPTLVSNPSAWTKVSNIIFLDLPAGTGFSYTTFPIATQRSDSKQVHHAHQFLRKWLSDHPEFLSNSIYIGGDSYSGIIVPPLTLEIVKGNEDGMEPEINIQGYLLGNPVTEMSKQENFRIPFAHGMGLISDELYESLKISCGGEYQNVDPSNKMCRKYIEAYNKSLSGINTGHILAPYCGSRSSLPTHDCSGNDIHLLAPYWANDDTVRKALGILEGSIGKWERCIVPEIVPYTYEIESSVPFHAELSKKSYRALVYSGDHDLLVTFIGTQAWIRSLNYSIVDEWRPWHVKGQVEGYTRSYSNGMTFATVKGGSHLATEDRPEECFAMFERWMSDKEVHLGEPIQLRAHESTIEESSSGNPKKQILKSDGGTVDPRLKSQRMQKPPGWLHDYE